MKKSALTVVSALIMAAALLVSCSDGSSPDNKDSGSGMSADALRSALAGSRTVNLSDYETEEDVYMVSGTPTITGDAPDASFMVRKAGTTFRDANVKTVYIEESVEDGEFTAENCTIKTMLVSGGGSNSVHVNGGNMGSILVGKADVRIAFGGNAEVESIFSLIGNLFQGRIEAESGSSVSIAKSDSAVAAKASSVIAIADRNAERQTTDALTGRAFVEYDDDDGQPYLNMAYYFAEGGKWYCWNGNDHGELLGESPTLATLKELASQELEESGTGGYLYENGILILRGHLIGHSSVWIDRYTLTETTSGYECLRPETYELSEYEYEDGETYVNPCERTAEIYYHKNGYEVDASAEENGFSGDESSGTIKLTGKYDKDSNGVTEKDNEPFTATASYSVSGGTMTLKFKIDGTEFTLTGGLDDSKEVWTEVK